MSRWLTGGDPAQMYRRSYDRLTLKCQYEYKYQYQYQYPVQSDTFVSFVDVILRNLYTFNNFCDYI